VLAALACAGAAACGDDLSLPEVCAQAVRRAPPTQCGPTLDLTPINSYDGAIDAVQEREGAVALIAGTCTGTLIDAAAGPVVMTAGHCVGRRDEPLVAFNVEDMPDGDQLVTASTVIERSDAPDYALLQLDTLPEVSPTTLTSRPTGRLAVIQHARGAPKSIAEGTFVDSCGGLLYYVDLDTLVGSSGAGVLTEDGSLVGVHVDGDCMEDGSGTNRAVTAIDIVEASSYLQRTDIAAP
jgi:hypothetical protein